MMVCDDCGALACQCENHAVLNTDRELWRGTHTAGDYYADSVFVTDRGGIGIHTGGYNVVKTPREWVDLAWPPCEECGGRVGHIHWCSSGRPHAGRLARVRAFFARCAPSIRSVSR